MVGEDAEFDFVDVDEGCESEYGAVEQKTLMLEKLHEQRKHKGI